MAELSAGQRVRTDTGNEAEVISLIGEGGQGEVYKVRFRNREYALKWYYPRYLSKLRSADEFYNNLKDNILMGSPSEDFLWPLDIAQRRNGSFGYIMDLRPGNFKDFKLFLLAKAKFASLEAKINAALNIIRGFRALHTRGFSYQDLNDGNFFIDPQNGEVLICDNDNVAPFGKNLGVGGKMRYMAPEIVTGRKLPDAETDKFSLAVVLFYLFFSNHPLEGARTMCPCMTDGLEKRYYGREPVFILDPNDESNRPVRGIHKNVIDLWQVFPEFVRDAFVKAFGKEAMTGEDITNRVIEKEWQGIFTRLRDITARCDCGGETFFDLDRDESVCIACDRTLPRPPVLKIQNHRIALRPNKRICKSQVIPDNDEFNALVGQVVRSREDPNLWGLRNEGGDPWDAHSASGDRRTIGRGCVVPARMGFRINFGSSAGEIL
ncbi:MAG: serine/threonine-protein kinase [Synergistaceae bacterium]|nr:serine/threonine-protein kinase [Synergistaceae bacterium]